MEERSPKSKYNILRLIIFAGVILDIFSVHSIWKQLNDKEAINKALVANGVSLADVELGGMLTTMQQTGTILLLLFLIFDFYAYYSLFEHKNWARRYVLSIAILYLIGCYFDFSSIYFLYSIATIYFLRKPDLLKS